MKVNKRIGKLKQWTGEKLGGQSKTELSEDFQNLEQDVELRRVGVDKLYAISKDLVKQIGKKVEVEEAEGAKFMPTEALGIICVNHGDEFSGDSAFGASLRAYGRAHQEIGTITAGFLDSFSDNWLSALEKSIAQFGEYTNQRKKLDSRRLTYDSMLSKVQKSKKEKAELESDLRLAKNRYEETSEEVQQRAVAIQDSETDQLIALSKLLEDECAFIDSYKQILDKVRTEWPDQNLIKRKQSIRSKGTAHTFGAELAPAPKPSIRARSTASKSRDVTPEPEPEDVEDDEEVEPAPRRMSVRSRSSTVTRKRSTGDLSNGNSDRASRFGGIRIPGLPGGSPSKDYSSMVDEGTEDDASMSRRRSTATRSDAPPLRRSLTAPEASQPSKIVEAKWDYLGSESDELSFHAGDRILVLTEINSEWFTGQSEVTGQSGMFPAAYTIPLPSRRTTGNKHPSSGILWPDRTGMSDTSDTFADPLSEQDDYEDESENAALRPNGGAAAARSAAASSIGVTAAAAMRHVPSLPKLSVGGTGKRAPPPPPARRATTAGSKSTPSQQSEGPEAFGSVSELKKRLGMFK